ncbi:MAG: hypothetical protein K2X48_00490 [Chitinophagaceae bacterium]|nr:hypothetical protein [Chitinophagaceae bacterium]
MKWIFIISFLTNAFFLFAQDSVTVKKKWELRGYIKNLESLSFDKNFKNLIAGNLLHNRLNIKWMPNEKWTAVAQFRNRLIWGDEVRLVPEYAKQLRNPNEKLNLQKPWLQNKSLVLHTNTERLYVDFREENINVRIGRQRINWGIGATWNPNDIFNAYNFLDFDYEERPGADGGKVQYLFNSSFNAELAYAHTGQKNGNVAAIKYALNKWNYDLQLITGWYNEHPTVGAGWAGSIKDAGFKGELQYYFGNKDSANHFNATVEADYMFKKGWYVSTGFLYVHHGLTKPVTDFTNINLKLSPENLMPTRWNFIVTAAKEFTPLLSGNMSVLYAPGTNFVILLPSLKYNIATNLDVDIIAQSFFTQLNNKFEAVNHRGFLRMKWSF